METNAPDRNAFLLIGLNEFGVIAGPGLIKLRFQLSTVKHIVVVLHECRWTPGAAKNSELPSGGGHCLFDKWNAKFLVVADAKRLQFLVAFIDIGITFTREIAAVNIGSC